MNKKCEKLIKILSVVEIIAVLCSAAGCGMPLKEEPESVAVSTQSGESTIPSVPETTSQPTETTESNPDYTAQDVVEWIKEKSEGTSGLTLEEADQWGEKTLQPEVGETLLQWGRETYQKESEDKDVLAIRDHLLNVERIYYGLYGQELLMPAIRAIQGKYRAEMQYNELTDPYPMPLSDFNVSTGTYFIDHRLDEKNSQRAAEALEKQHEGATSDHDSYWVVYDTSDAGDGRFYTGETKYILQVNQEFPFESQGGYSFAYAMAGVSISVQDEMGFRDDISILVLMGNSEKVTADLEKAEKISGDQEKYNTILDWFVNPDNSRFYNREQEETLVISGEYVGDYSSSIHIKLSPEFGTAESLDAAPFTAEVGRLITGDGSVEHPIYKLGKNAYFAHSAGCAVTHLSAYKENGQIMLEHHFMGGLSTYCKK